MSLRKAVAQVSHLRTLLSEEIKNAQEERTYLRTLDAPMLLKCAQRREMFNLGFERAQTALLAEMNSVASAHSLSDASIGALAGTDSEFGATFEEIMFETRAQAQALTELHHLHRDLAQRSLAVVHRYLQALRLPPVAYARNGKTQVSVELTHSHVSTSA